VDDETVTLAYTEWALVELKGELVAIAADELTPMLVLDLEESRVSGSGGCNRLAGTFTLSEDELLFGPLMTTRMACPGAAMEREQTFIGALGRVTRYELEGTMLTLLAEDEAVVRLSPRSALPLAGLDGIATSDHDV
jgi:heat shock protein HslJ